MYKVVGITFRPQAVQQFYYTIAEGNLGFIEREPGNQYDPNAVRVLALHHGTNKFVFIGYLPKGMDKVFKGNFATIRFIKDRRFEIIAEYDKNPHQGVINAAKTITL
jgi:hypothetical protein